MAKATNTIGVRWTIGDVSLCGFEALRLSIWGARKVFGHTADYVVCVNSLAVERARERTGSVPAGVHWQQASAQDVPAFLWHHLDGAMAEGVGWKFAPLQLFPDRYELALDNDCILWEMPRAIEVWLRRGVRRCVFAEDVRTCLGQFETLAGNEPRNSGIRGLPPGFDLENAFRRVLEQRPVMLASELDEQGLQAAAVSLEEPPLVVRTDEVTICSPFLPHQPHLGRCGAHFVGLNARQLPWEFQGRPAVDYVREHWRHHRATLCGKVGLEED